MVPYLLTAKVSEWNVLKRHDSQHKCYIISNIFTIMRNTEKLRYLSCLLSEAQLEIKSIIFIFQSPINLYSLLDANHDIELVLRLTNFLADVIDITCLREIRARDLPIEFKAPQSETIYSAFYGYEATELLLKRLNGMLSVPHEDVVYQVKKFCGVR